MLFTTLTFCFIFLSIVWLVFLGLRKCGLLRAVIPFLVFASLFFYAWWEPKFLWVIGSSLGVNYLSFIYLSRIDNKKLKKYVLGGGILFNIGLIFFFKYSFFFAEIIASITNSDPFIGKLVLPLGISFFTFQQIMFLVDTYKEKVKQCEFWDYLFYVLFFPQLIAGPIVHHSAVFSQFEVLRTRRDISRMAMTGVVIFMLGVVKKVIFADSLAELATPIFTAAEHGMSLSTMEAWEGVLCYGFQLYFDFSGYCDMAIGLGMLFGINLPWNFRSPYKALSIGDFWRRWHITLSNFLRDYIYIPLGGNRGGNFKVYRNLALTMLIGGIWHGAGWTFIIWGLMHGFYLCVHKLITKLKIEPATRGRRYLWGGLSWAITFFAVLLAWVVFRAESLAGAMQVYEGMFSSKESFDYNRFTDYELDFWGIANYQYQLMIIALIAFIGPSSWKLVEKMKEAKPMHLAFASGFSLVIVFVTVLINLSRGSSSEFLYFNF